MFPATQGDEALALVRRERPDLVVLDVQMPRLDGLLVTQTLAAPPRPLTVVDTESMPRGA